jgi:hypothetical protein
MGAVERWNGMKARKRRIRGRNKALAAGIGQ